MKIRKNVRMCSPISASASWLLFGAMFAALFLSQAVTANAQDVVTRVYPLDAYLSSPLAESDGVSRAQQFGGGGGGGMGGGGFGGGGGGGGMFHIPDSILPQFGSAPADFGYGAVSVDDILTLLNTHLTKPDTFRVSVLGTSLWVTATEGGHSTIKDMLTMLGDSQKNQRSLKIDLRMVTLSPEDSDKFVNATGAEATGAIAKLAAASDAAKVMLRCDNHRIGSISSGLKRSYVVGATPVVGSEVANARSVGYQTQTEEYLLGLFGRVRPRIENGADQGRIQLSIQLTSGPEPGKIEAADLAEGRIDRLELEMSTLETTVAAKANEWTLAGVSALTEPGSGLTAGQALSHMVTLVRWSEGE